MVHFKTSPHKSAFGKTAVKETQMLPNGLCTLAFIFSMFASWDHQCPLGRFSPDSFNIYWVYTLLTDLQTFINHIRMIHLPWAVSLSLGWFLLLVQMSTKSCTIKYTAVFQKHPKCMANTIRFTPTTVILGNLLQQTSRFWLRRSWTWRHPSLLQSRPLLCSRFLPPLCCAAICLLVCLSLCSRSGFICIPPTHPYSYGSRSLHAEMCACVGAGFNWAVVRGDPPHWVSGGEGAGIPLFSTFCIFYCFSPPSSHTHQCSCCGGTRRLFIRMNSALILHKSDKFI